MRFRIQKIFIPIISAVKGGLRFVYMSGMNITQEDGTYLLQENGDKILTE